MASGLFSALSTAIFLILGAQGVKVAWMTITSVSTGIGYLSVLLFSLLPPAAGILLSIPRTREWLDSQLELSWRVYAAAIVVFLALSYIMLALNVSVSTQLMMTEVRESLQGLNQPPG